MPYYLEVPLSSGETVLAEITEQADGVAPFGRGKDVLGQLPGTFADGLEQVRAFAAEVLTSMKNAVEPRDQVAVEFGLTLSAKVGVVVAESAAEGHVTVTVEWFGRRAATTLTDLAPGEPSKVSG